MATVNLFKDNGNKDGGLTWKLLLNYKFENMVAMVK